MVCISGSISFSVSLEKDATNKISERQNNEKILEHFPRRHYQLIHFSLFSSRDGICTVLKMSVDSFTLHKFCLQTDPDIRTHSGVRNCVLISEILFYPSLNLSIETQGQENYSYDGFFFYPGLL